MPAEVRARKCAAWKRAVAAVLAFADDPQQDPVRA
jgi:hypothetical protein